ncbi:hypothetical protein F5Y12DRAFT_349712 [Xylaria sp. FL1777]|nr:hypothetical protein F5Y12DRAFT_349712 [Xylaria sp. FL1777]
MRAILVPFWLPSRPSLAFLRIRENLACSDTQILPTHRQIPTNGQTISTLSHIIAHTEKSPQPGVLNLFCSNILETLNISGLRVEYGANRRLFDFYIRRNPSRS